MAWLAIFKAHDFGLEGVKPVTDANLTLNLLTNDGLSRLTLALFLDDFSCKGVKPLVDQLDPASGTTPQPSFSFLNHLAQTLTGNGIAWAMQRNDMNPRP